MLTAHYSLLITHCSLLIAHAPHRHTATPPHKAGSDIRRGKDRKWDYRVKIYYIIIYYYIIYIINNQHFISAITMVILFLLFYTSPTSDRYKRGGVAVWRCDAMSNEQWAVSNEVAVWRLREERKTAGSWWVRKRLYICKSKIIMLMKTEIAKTPNFPLLAHC